MDTQRLPRHPLRNLPGRDTVKNRRNYTIMLAGLYAQLFRRFPTPATLTRWADLEEEVSNL